MFLPTPHGPIAHFRQSSRIVIKHSRHSRHGRDRTSMALSCLNLALPPTVSESKYDELLLTKSLSV